MQSIAEVLARWRPAAGPLQGRDPVTNLPICGTCQRLGHPLCGLKYWISLRAAWLRLPEQLVAEEPKSFEDPGTIQLARQAEIGFVREISEGEAEDLEDRDFSVDEWGVDQAAWVIWPTGHHF
ncbi:Uncharacterized protein SCF082_LOCUS34011 [Durusdinium trenchii]|uniref:Uncharacterized protein n=1 Tax=Durusdinium trenchii TaxID=1381693 RepID=A0ABP0NU45_9DINO